MSQRTAPSPADTEADSDATRERILGAAMSQFEAHGYHATSLRQIAEHIGISKAAVLYHFTSKDAILAALAEPLLCALEAAVARAAQGPRDAAPTVLIEGLLDTWLSHRYLLRLNLQDLALASAGLVFERFRAAMLRANSILAGPKPDLARKVRAAQALAMLGDPVVLYADAPTAELRGHIIEGAQRLLGPELLRTSGPARGAAKGGRRRGRPSSVDARMAERARRMYAAGESAADIAEKLGISRATVYRHLS